MGVAASALDAAGHARDRGAYCLPLRDHPKRIFPATGHRPAYGRIQGDQSTSFQAMSRLLTQFAKIVKEDPAVDNVIAFTGGAGTANTGRMFVSLKPQSERRLSADQVIGRLRGKLSQIAGATLYLQAVQDVRVGGRASNAQYQYTLRSDKLEDLIQWTPRLFDRLRTLRALTDVNSDQQNRGLEIDLDIDRATASRLGVTQQAIDNTLNDAFGQRQVSTIFKGLNQYHVVLEVDPELTQDPDTVRSLYVPASNGTQVPLSAIARYGRSPTPLSVNHQGQFPAATISFNLAPDVSIGEAVQQIQTAETELGMPVPC